MEIWNIRAATLGSEYELGSGLWVAQGVSSVHHPQISPKHCLGGVVAASQGAIYVARPLHQGTL